MKEKKLCEKTIRERVVGREYVLNQELDKNTRDRLIFSWQDFLFIVLDSRIRNPAVLVGLHGTCSSQFIFIPWVFIIFSGLCPYLCLCLVTKWLRKCTPLEQEGRLFVCSLWMDFSRKVFCYIAWYSMNYSVNIFLSYRRRNDDAKYKPFKQTRIPIFMSTFMYSFFPCFIPADSVH